MLLWLALIDLLERNRDAASRLLVRPSFEEARPWLDRMIARLDWPMPVVAHYQKDHEMRVRSIWRRPNQEAARGV